MEFRAQDQMRATSATATSSLGFNTSSSHNLTKADHHHQSPGGAERRRSSSISNTHNGNSAPTGLMINTPTIATNTSNNCTYATQTLDQNFQPTARALQPAAQPQAPARDLEITPPSGAKPKTTSSSSSAAAAAAAVKYKECLKNHAASVGGSVFDGCGEFMPSGEEGSLEALKCAACQCHRNFHRKEVDGEAAGQLLYSPGSRRSSTNAATNALMLNPLQLTPPLALPSPTGLHHLHHHHHHNPHHPHHHKYPIVQPMSVAYGGCGGGNESSSEELNAGYGGSADNSAPPYHHPQQPFGMSKKRFRTKFTQDQKERMLEFAERMGWRLQKQDEEEVERFCADVGVKRQVLKVWMHNNKSTNVNKTKQQLEHVNAMMGNLGNTVLSAANDDDANMINQVSADDQLEEGELDT